MNSPVFSVGRWLCPPEFSGEKPVDIFHKQREKRETELPDRLKNVHFYVHRAFSFHKSESRVTLRLTADDYCKLTVNGRFVCQGPAQGYPWHYHWNEADITDFLCEGTNVVEAHCHYCGLENRAYTSGDRRLGFIAELWQGNECLLATDETWETCLDTAFLNEKTIGYSTMYAEDYDMRRPRTPWMKAAVLQPDYTFAPTPTATLQVYEKAPAVTEALPGGGIFCDFGELLTGTLRIHAEGKDGARLRILTGEETEDSPERVRYRMRCSCVCEEFVTLAEGENDWSQYDYRGFRYAAVIPEGEVKSLQVTAAVRHWPFDDGYCTLQTENPVLQSVWDICKRGVKYGSQEVFVDCPTREKGQYTGDLVITGHAQPLLTGDASLLRKALEDLEASARICPGLMAVAPGGYMQEIADYSLEYPILALRYFKMTGDIAFLERCLKVSDNMLDHFAAFAREDGLLEKVDDKWNLVDWPDNLRDGYDFPLTDPIGPGCHNVINALYVGAVMLTEKMAALLGKEPHRRSKGLIAAFQAEFFDPEAGLFCDCKGSGHSSLHANVFPAYFGICPPSAEKSIGDFLVEKGVCCGVYVAYFMLKALCRLGRYEDAYALIVSEGEHSWYNMVREGATTCFEAWGKEQKWNTSLCHPWASAPIAVLAEDVLPHMPWVGKLIINGVDPSADEGGKA